MKNTNKKKELRKGLWDWFELLAKFLPAILVAVIAFMGNQFLQNKQKSDSNLKLYTQLLANKENSENTLRKDMFSEMLQSFLAPIEGGHEDQIGSDEKTIIKIRKDLLSLELLARNFHESLDMKPLFKHVLMEIIRPRINLRREDRKLRHMIEASNLLDQLASVQNGQINSKEKTEIEKTIQALTQRSHRMRPVSKKEEELKETLGVLEQEINQMRPVSDETIMTINSLLLDVYYKNELSKSFDKRSLHSDHARLVTDAKIFRPEASLIAKIKKQHKKVNRLLAQHDRELKRLISIAKRVTRKQREVLEDVSGKFRLMIPLKGFASTQICTSVNPNDIYRLTLGMCPDAKELEQGSTGRLVQGVEEKGELFYLNSNGNPDDQSKRYFSIKVRYAYPQWKQVYVEIVTGPDQTRYLAWQVLSALRRRCETELLNKDSNQDCKNVIYTELTQTYDIKIDKARMMMMSVGEFEQFLKASLDMETARFWLEYFDFPLVDNTYINSRQRYSVVLEGFNSGRDGEDESAQIALLYYPASYAGLKEKSFYNNQLMNYLMEQDFFTGSEETVSN